MTPGLRQDGDAGECTARELPETLPIFPLTGVLMLPRGELPLNIFEPRYLNMTDAAMDGAGMIGLVQPLIPEADPIADDAALFETGCVGEITSFRETDDGRYLISLTGISRFRIARELEPVGGFRMARADYDGFAQDREMDGEANAPAIDSQRLKEALRVYFGFRGLQGDWTSMEKTTDENLVTALAMACPLEPREKQALLESPTVAERAALLTSLLEMACLGIEWHGAEGAGDGVRH